MTVHRENMNAETLTYHQTISSENTYAQTTTTKEKRKELNKSPQDDNTPQSDIKPSEIRGLMDMLKQIMQQMTTLTNLLLTLTFKISQSLIP